MEPGGAAESADIAATEQLWAEIVGVPVESFGRTSLKHHNPTTVRRNTGSNYHGCLVVYVLQGADTYRLMAGVWRGIVEGVNRRRCEHAA